jgi:DNA repair protein RadC
MDKLSIKEWAIEDRPREKMLEKGASALSNVELLAILIRSGSSKETAVQLAQRILCAADNNLNTLGKLSIKELTTGFKGMGEAKALSIVAALELGRRRSASERTKTDCITCSKDVYTLFYPLLCDLSHEEMWAAFTNHAARVIDKIKISQGGIGETTVDVRLILRAGIQSLASGIFLCHNHPSGNLHPSPQDDALTHRIKSAAQLVGLSLLDHLILSDNSYYSYADEGRLNG